MPRVTHGIVTTLDPPEKARSMHSEPGARRSALTVIPPGSTPGETKPSARPLSRLEPGSKLRISAPNRTAAR